MKSFFSFLKSSNNSEVHSVLQKIHEKRTKISSKDLEKIWKKYPKSQDNPNTLDYETAILFLNDCSATFNLGYTPEDIRTIIDFSWQYHEGKLNTLHPNQNNNSEQKPNKVLHYNAFAQLLFEVAQDARLELTQSMQSYQEKIMPPSPLWRGAYDLTNSVEDVGAVLRSSQHLMEQAKKVKQEQHLKNRSVHVGFTCNFCLRGPIVGDRHHCIQCGNYDLCSICYQKPKEIDEIKWTEHLSEQGVKFYWNTESGHSQWNPPHRSDHYMRTYKAPISVEPRGGGVFHRETVYLSIEAAFRAFPTRPLFGWRSSIKNWLAHPTPNEEYSWMTFQQVFDLMAEIGSGLQTLFPARTFACISGIDRPEWIVTDLACCRQNYVIVPIDVKMDLNALKHILDSTKCEFTVCSEDLVEKFCQATIEKRQEKAALALSTLVSMEDTLSSSQMEMISKAGLNHYSLRQIREIGKKNIVPPNPQKPDELFSLCYTSGSTGLPKGAMFENKTYNSRIAVQYTMPNPLVTLAYCSFAHMMDRQMSYLTILYGGQQAMYSGDLRTLWDDFRAVKPCMISTTPHLYNELYAEFKEDLAKLKKEVGNDNLKYLQGRERLLRAAASKLGGNIESVTTGGAATSEKVMQFLKETFRCHFTHGYAATETGGIYSFGYGKNANVDLKLVDVPDMGYYVKGTPSRGEICIKSKIGISGYFNNPEATKASWDSDGYWHSGDIGEMNEKGEIKIIDRLKSIFKNSLGEFIAPDKVERVLLESKYVHQLFLYGNALHPFVVAIVVPQVQRLEELAKDQGISGSLSELCANPNINRLVLAEIRRTGVQEKLPNHEIPRFIHLTPKEFSKEAGQLTTTMKVKRPALEQSFKTEIQELYKSSEDDDDDDDQAEDTIDLSDDIELPIEDRLAFALARRMKLDVLSESARRVPLSLDSLQTVRMIRTINEIFHIEIPLQILMKDPSLSDLALYIEGAVNPEKARQVFDEQERVMSAIKRDMEISFSVSPNAAPPNTGSPEAVLLTGATGFIGIFVLQELLKSTKATIYCLMRGTEDRLKKICQRAKVEYDDARIKVIDADLGASNLATILAPYSKVIDLIFHSGAYVNSIKSYNALSAINTQGTVHLINFALQNKIKPFHFVSTMGVWGGSPQAEDTPLISKFSSISVLNGYSQSKWVAEYLVTKASKIGLPTTVHRPSMVCSHSKTGYANESDFFNRILICFIQIGAAIDSSGIYDITPVDFVARGIVEISLNPKNYGRFFQYANHAHSMTMRQLAEAMIDFGFPLQIVPYQEFLKVKEGYSTEAKNALEVLRPYFTKFGWNPDHGQISTSNMLAALKVDHPPAITKDHVAKLLTFLIDQGVVKKP